MRVVLDSNVLISALISAGSPPDLIYRAWREKRFTLVTSKTQLAELRPASRYPKLQKLVPSREFGVLINRLHGALVLDKLPRVVIWAFIKEAGQRARQNPEQASRLDLLRRYVWSK